MLARGAIELFAPGLDETDQRIVSTEGVEDPLRRKGRGPALGVAAVDGNIVPRIELLNFKVVLRLKPPAAAQVPANIIPAASAETSVFFIDDSKLGFIFLFRRIDQRLIGQGTRQILKIGCARRH